MADAKEPEALSTTKRVKYQPQINVSDELDDPDSYMLFGPAKKRPILQIVASAFGILFAVLALGFDEMSDGDVHFSEPIDYLDELDYDCGWRSFRYTLIYEKEYENNYANKIEVTVRYDTLKRFNI